MISFVENVLAFPTVVFTVLLGFVALYALFVALGAVDLDDLDGMFGASEGVEAGADALEAGLSGRSSLYTGLANAFRTGGVPFTIYGSFLALWGWVLSFLFTLFAGDALPSGLAGWLVRGGAAVGALFVAAPLASFTVRPLRKFFTTQKAETRYAMVGKFCTIRSTRVDEQSGQAEIDDGGSGFLAEVRSSEPNTLTVGRRALVFGYDSDTGVFRVAPLDPVLEAAERKVASAAMIHQ